MAIYLVRHPDPLFKGVLGGLDFWNGIASTNCRQYAEEVARAINGQVMDLIDLKQEDEKEMVSEKKARKK